MKRDGREAREILKSRKRELKTWQAVAESIGGVSPALCWKVAKRGVYSAKIERALGLTNERNKAKGWHRRAAWIHADDMPAYEAMLARYGVSNLQELVDFEMLRRDGRAGAIEALRHFAALPADEWPGTWPAREAFGIIADALEAAQEREEAR